MGDTPEQETPEVAEATEPTTTPVAPQYLTKEEAAQLIADAVAKARETGRDIGRREMQSFKDQHVRDAIRARQAAEAELAAVNSGFDGLDESTKMELENRRLRARVQTTDSLSLQEEQQRQFAQTIADFESDQKEHVTDLGIDQNDKRIEWGDSSTMSLRDRNRVFLASIRKIQKADKETSKAEIAKLVKTEVEKRDNAAGIHSVDTAVAPGVKKDKSWEEVRAAFIQNPYDPEVRARYNEMRNKRH